MSFEAPHIMLLDEPTNHLDIDAREALIQALNNYTGAIILVSHDPHLVECVADQLWLVADGTCKPFDDDLETYRKLVIRQRRLEREKAKKDSGGQKQNSEANTDANTKVTEEDIKKQERLMADLGQRKQDIEGEMADCYTKDEDQKRLKRLHASYEAIQKEYEAAEAGLARLIEQL